MAKANKVEVALTGDTKNFVVSFQEAGKVAANVEKNIKGSTTAANSMQKSFRGAANATAILNGPLNGISGRLSSMSAAFGTLNPAVIAAGVGFSTMSAVVIKSLGAFTEYESQMLRLEAVVKATGGAAGLTAKDMDAMSKSIGMATLANADQVRSAAATLATFKNIGRDSFEPTLVMAQDLSEVLGQDLKTSVMLLGKALDDPITGLTALRRAAVTFSESQKESIRNMVEMGNVAGAQGIILAELATKVGGAGTAAAGGLKGKVDSLSESWLAFKETLGSSAIIQGTAAGSLDLLTGAVERLDSAVSPTSATEYFNEIKKLQNQLSTGIADDPEADSDQSRAVVEARLALARKGYDEQIKIEEDAVAASLEARRKGDAVQGQLEEKRVQDAVENRRKETAGYLQAANNKALIAEQLALKVAGHLEAAEAIRYERESAASAAELQRIEDKVGEEEAIKEAFRRKDEALYEQHLANMAAIAEKRKEEEAQALEDTHKIWREKAERIAESNEKTAKEEEDAIKKKRKLNMATTQMMGESFALAAQMAEEGSRGQKAMLVAEKSMALARAAISMQVAIAKANEGDVYTKWANIALATTQGLAAISSIASVGIAHGGADYIPEESTYLLNRGERVLSPAQNRDLTKFLEGGGGGTIVNIVEDASKAGTVSRGQEDLTVYVAAAIGEMNRQINTGGGIATSMEKRYGLNRSGR